MAILALPIAAMRIMLQISFPKNSLWPVIVHALDIRENIIRMHFENCFYYFQSISKGQNIILIHCNVYLPHFLIPDTSTMYDVLQYKIPSA